MLASALPCAGFKARPGQVLPKCWRGLPIALTRAGALPLLVKEAVGSVALVAWARENGCPWTAGPSRYCSPRHWMPISSRDEARSQLDDVAGNICPALSPVKGCPLTQGSWCHN